MTEVRFPLYASDGCALFRARANDLAQPRAVLSRVGLKKGTELLRLNRPLADGIGASHRAGGFAAVASRRYSLKLEFRVRPQNVLTGRRGAKAGGRDQ